MLNLNFPLMLSDIFNYYSISPVSALELLQCRVSGNIRSHYNRLMESQESRSITVEHGPFIEIKHTFSLLYHSFLRIKQNSVATMSAKATRTSQLVPPCC